MRTQYEEIAHLYRNGATREAICRKVGCGSSTLSKALTDQRVPLRDHQRRDRRAELVQSVRELWELGRSQSVIGKALGITKNAVAGIVFRHGFTRDEAVSKANREAARKQNAVKLCRTPRAPKPPRPKREKAEVPQMTVIDAGNVPAVRVTNSGQVIAMQPSAELPRFPGATSKSRPKPWTERAPGECTWPVSGEGADTFSCCAPVAGGYSWCPDHCRVGRADWGGKGYSQAPEAYVAQIVRRCA